MAVRKKKDTSTTTGAEAPTEVKKRTSSAKKTEPKKKTAAAPKKSKPKTRAEEAVEELQTVGADVVPSVPVEVAVGAGGAGDSDRVQADLRKLEQKLKQADAGPLDAYLGRFGLHRPMTSEPWHVEATNP